MKARCGQEDCDCGHTIEKLVAELGAMVDWLVYWEAKPKNLAYTAIVAPKIAAARDAIKEAT